jgi:AcrR family transcriptional regulator
MTNSVRRGDKRERLVAAATDLLHRQGVQGTTLADIASAADVPLGNVYYYFKTRDDIVHAVIDRRLEELTAALSLLESRRTPKARLKGLAELWSESAEIVADHGCPLGGLSLELNKCPGQVTEHARALLARVVDWAEGQFRELGLRDPRGLAVHYVSGVQGAAVLANTFGDAPLLTAEVRRLGRWLDELA